jgi:hypothetical protein
MCMHVYFTVVSVPNKCGERYVLDAVCWPPLISRASMLSSGVISAFHSTWRQVFLLLIYRHYFLWHIDSSVGLLSHIRWHFVFSSWRGWRCWLDFIAILRTSQCAFLAFFALLLRTQLWTFRLEALKDPLHLFLHLLYTLNRLYYISCIYYILYVTYIYLSYFYKW